MRWSLADDAGRMMLALELARRAWGQTAPNPMVGAVIFNGDEKVGEGFHPKFGDRHAEAIAIERAGERARGGTLYVNLEPCNHQGRNPPCTEAIINSGISHVVAAVRDPNPIAAGGAERLKSAGIDITFGIGEREALELNAVFLNRVTSDRPWVILKLAVSLDSAISGEKRTAGWLTSEDSRAIVQTMRANSDAIAVGVQTAIADDPRLTVRIDPLPRVAPTRVVFDRSARLPAKSFLARTASEVPTLLVTANTTAFPPELESLGVEALRADDVGDALRKLRARGLASIMVEGGAGLAASFLAGGYVDRLVIFRAPIVLGRGALGAFSGVASLEIEHALRFDLLEVRGVGNDVMATYGSRVS